MNRKLYSVQTKWEKEQQPQQQIREQFNRPPERDGGRAQGARVEQHTAQHEAERQSDRGRGSKYKMLDEARFSKVASLLESCWMEFSRLGGQLEWSRSGLVLLLERSTEEIHQCTCASF